MTFFTHFLDKNMFIGAVIIFFSVPIFGVQNSISLNFGGANFFSDISDQYTPNRGFSFAFEYLSGSAISWGFRGNVIHDFCPVCERATQDTHYSLSGLGGYNFFSQYLNIDVLSGIGLFTGNDTKGQPNATSYPTTIGINFPIVARTVLGIKMSGIYLGVGIGYFSNINFQNNTSGIEFPIYFKY